MIGKLLWKWIDVILFVTAIGAFVYGFFLLGYIAGIFSIGVALIILGLLSESISRQEGR
ncbi:DUF1056 family protein [Lactobacillus delbrueckii]|uniref:DUF1056 family protein n=1 Tax=Lactobacillus delbrueckii subsp. allosunkii TaxID=1050107 RepID=A0ABD4S9F5_9LACO|nr:DUF1056 family protein [Lactobacillus delbrueckii]MCD5446162.1 DUF1056 family protein [Lactobacillus delbrueckii subsp. lactis]MCD5517411.1 DUF1056 family protein [Lactobacillus delbrueckii subsp. sunkii]MCT3475644.1 DUF1056 family protein [Lactobacillus delbrueckii subsp. lactis]MCZ0776445.1 DUF1056 family protein [Lactobacillus delbrueckii subsp. sunkii]MCZ0793534.1 DUF1056 family protein [Lactobacillus delbrueckii]